MFFIYLLSVMRSPRCWPIGAKFCKMVSTRPSFIMPVQNFGEGAPPKISGTKNMQNLARFWSTLKFGGEYLRNG